MADRTDNTPMTTLGASQQPDSATHSSATLTLWDFPLRLFHWMLVILVVSAVITVNIGGDAMVWHGQIGRLVLALLSFRLVWGVIGGHYARFRSFPLGSASLRAYLQGKWQGLGHNPLGAWSVLAMLAVVLGFAASGPFIGDDAAYLGPLFRAVDSARSDALHSWHESMQWPLYVLVALHIAAIIFYQRKGKDLLGPMRHGRVQINKASSGQTQSTATRPWALIVAVLIAAGVWWWSGGSWLPEPAPPPAAFDW